MKIYLFDILNISFPTGYEAVGPLGQHIVDAAVVVSQIGKDSFKIIMLILNNVQFFKY